MDLNSAILSFSQWGHPWKFEEVVVSMLSSSERKRFMAVLELANKEENWAKRDIEQGCDSAHKSLKAAFMELQDEALVAVVRAVSYQWR